MIESAYLGERTKVCYKIFNEAISITMRDVVNNEI